MGAVNSSLLSAYVESYHAFYVLCGWLCVVIALLPINQEAGELSVSSPSWKDKHPSCVMPSQLTVTIADACTNNDTTDTATSNNEAISAVTSQLTNIDASHVFHFNPPKPMPPPFAVNTDYISTNITTSKDLGLPPLPPSLHAKRLTTNTVMTATAANNDSANNFTLHYNSSTNNKNTNTTTAGGIPLLVSPPGTTSSVSPGSSNDYQVKTFLKTKLN